jgi:hypothetical protein
MFDSDDAWQLKCAFDEGHQHCSQWCNSGSQDNGGCWDAQRLRLGGGTVLQSDTGEPRFRHRGLLDCELRRRAIKSNPLPACREPRRRPTLIHGAGNTGDVMHENVRWIRFTPSRGAAALLGLCVLLLSGLLFAQQPEPPASKKGSIAGSVINSQSGQPISNAEVSLTRQDATPVLTVAGGGPVPPPTMWRAMTDPRGRYQFADLEAGRYSLWVQRQGFGNSENSVSGARLLLSAGEVAPGVDIELTPKMSMSGRVVDEAGEPVPYVGVRVLQEQYIKGRKQLSAARGGGVQANERGEFLLAGVWTGPIVLELAPIRVYQPTPTGATPAAPDMVYSVSYYPGTADVSKALRIEPSPGVQRSGLEGKMLKTRASRIKGSVRDHTGQLAANCSVLLKPMDTLGDPFLMAHVTKAQNGAFEFQHIVPGPYRLVVQLEDGARAHRDVLTVGPRDIDDLRVQLPEPVQVDVELVFKEGVKIDPKNVFVSLHMDEAGVSSSPMGRIASDGVRYIIPGVFPGKYRIGASWLNDNLPAATAYVERIQYGERETTDAPVEITTRPSPIRVTFNDGTGSLTGIVTRNNAPARRAQVLLLSADESRRLDQVWNAATWTYENGGFAIQRLKPGDYLAFAFEEIEDGFWRNEARFKQFAGSAKKVSIGRKGSVTLNLEVMPLPR